MSIFSHRFKPIVAAGVILLGLTANGWGSEINWADHQIEVSGFSEEQRQVVDETFNRFEAIRSGELKIDRSLYRRLSRFEKLFGRPLNGEDLAAWVLSRFRKVAYGNSRLAAINQNKGELWVGDLFFEGMTPLERLYLLIHEARHSDGDGYPHVRCPKGFRFISAGQPWMELEKEPACDTTDTGAYAYQAAFLFELFAYGIFDQKEVGLLYNSTVARILP
jgi:hypothetical protein